MKDDDWKTYISIYPKIRLGNINDGGYVIADAGTYDFYLAAGIGNNYSFDSDFINKYGNIPSKAFDGNINSVSNTGLQIYATKELALAKADEMLAQWKVDNTIPAVEAQPAVYDPDGVIVVIPAVEAQPEIVPYSPVAFIDLPPQAV